MGIIVDSHYIKECSYNYETGQENCPAHHIFLVALRHLGEHLDVISALITAVATGVIPWFTRTIWLINRSQLRHSHQVERAYISGGEALEMQQIDLGTETVHGPGGVGSISRHRGFEGRPTGYFTLCVNNYGKTAGQLWEFGIGFCDAKNIPEIPVYERRYRMAVRTRLSTTPIM